MIVKRNLGLRRIAAYTAGPMTWTVAWAVAVTTAYAVTDDPRWTVPFAPVGAIGAALAIFVGFRNNAAIARWNEARAAWQTVLVASRALARQVVASTDNAVASGAASEEQATAFRRRVVLRLAAFAPLLAARVGRPVDTGRLADLLGGSAGAERVLAAANPPDEVLADLAIDLKAGIRTGVLGQFDPISTEPQLGALQQAAGVVERIATTPTLRQYDYFTRRFVQLFAALLPFAVVGLVPDAVWWAVPLSVGLAGVFVMMAVTGAANDEPFSGRVTDVPVDAVVIEVERDLRARLGDDALPPAAVAVDGYLW